MKTFLSIEPNDGYNQQGKYGWIETAFSEYYLRFFEATPKSFDLELIEPDTKKKIEYKNIPSYSYKKMKNYFKILKKIVPKNNFEEASTFSIDSISNTATLTVNTFETSNYKNGKEGFHNFLEKTFKTISQHTIKNLIIDIRKNEGGAQGMEDYLLSYLIDKPYNKYKYVEIPSFTYSFLKYTNYKNESDILKRELKEDFYRNNDGRYLNMKGHYEGTAPNKNNFKGKIYILTGRLTFSGGSEFVALAKNYTNAIFIGEETNGGFYGNTSGSFLKFTLPNSQLTGRIPLCKFVLESKNFDIPFGHGVIPNYKIKENIQDYLNGIDTPMKFTINLIDKKE
ncbi:MAG: S41 family peptidase [Polaribacter sp.]